MFERKSLLAKLLAKEDISVIRDGNVTASFDVVNRVLRLPLWDDMTTDLYDLLEGHEVGHALYTPAEGWHHSTVELGIRRSYVNIIEDIRIERKICDTYPGLVYNFKQGYKELLKRNFFGLDTRSIGSLGFMDRLNLKAKCRTLVEVEFSAEELPYFNQAMAVETFDDVIASCLAITAWLKDKKKEETKPEPKEDKSEEDEQASEESQDSDEDSEKALEESEDSDEDSDEDSEKASDEDSEKASEKASDEDSDEGETPFQGKTSSGEQSDSLTDDEDSVDEQTYTDDTFRKMEEELVEVDDKGKTPIVCEGLLPTFKDSNVISSEEIMKSRQTRYEECSNQIATWYEKQEMNKVELEYLLFLEDNKKIVSQMSREFEMRKAAFQQSRATESKSGQLDVTKLANYKFTEDLFLRNNNIADAKSHGMVAIIDFSGSMARMIKSVVEQAIVLAMFCRKTNIPFDIYSFTSNGGVTEYNKNRRKNREMIAEQDAKLVNGGSYINTDQVRIVTQLSSSMTNKEFNEAAKMLFYTYAKYDVMGGGLDRLGTTPLNETLIYMHDALKAFKMKHGIQKVNFVAITDGATSAYYSKTGGKIQGRNLSSSSAPRDYMKIGNSYKKCFLRADLATIDLLDMIRESGVNVIGYYLVPDLGKLRMKLTHLDLHDTTPYVKEYNADKIVALKNIKGYDTFFIINGNVKAQDDEFAVKDNAKKADIARAFKKFSKSKKSNRALATKFAIAVS